MFPLILTTTTTIIILLTSLPLQTKISLITSPVPLTLKVNASSDIKKQLLIT